MIVFGMGQGLGVLRVISHPLAVTLSIVVGLGIFYA